MREPCQGFTRPDPGQGFTRPDKIREATIKATETDAKMAEEEWKRVTHEQGSPHFSAAGAQSCSPPP